jgi:hypothetical protein
LVFTRTEKRKLYKLPYVEELELVYKLHDRFGERIYGSFKILRHESQNAFWENALGNEHFDLYIESVKKMLRNIQIVTFRMNNDFSDFGPTYAEYEFIMFPAEDSAIVPSNG